MIPAVFSDTTSNRTNRHERRGNLPTPLHLFPQKPLQQRGIGLTESNFSSLLGGLLPLPELSNFERSPPGGGLRELIIPVAIAASSPRVSSAARGRSPRVAPSRPGIGLCSPRRRIGGTGHVIRPLQDRTIVKRIDEDETTAGGIIISDTATEKPQERRVVGAGKGKRRDPEDDVFGIME